MNEFDTQEKQDKVLYDSLKFLNRQRAALQRSKAEFRKKFPSGRLRLMLKIPGVEPPKFSEERFNAHLDEAERHTRAINLRGYVLSMHPATGSVVLRPRENKNG